MWTKFAAVYLQEKNSVVLWIYQKEPVFSRIRIGDQKSAPEKKTQTTLFITSNNWETKGRAKLNHMRELSLCLGNVFIGGYTLLNIVQGMEELCGAMICTAELPNAYVKLWKI